MTTTQMFENYGELGPDVRIGILQGAGEARIELLGDYRIVCESGTAITADRGITVICTLDAGKSARLAYRLVLKKTRQRIESGDAAWSAVAPLEPLQLGVSMGDGISAAEWWLCSRPYDSRAEAEQARASLPHPERIGILAVRLAEPSGTVMVTVNGLAPVNAGRTVRLEPADADTARLRLHDVIVGIEYHWRHNERQLFRGALEVRAGNDGKVAVINEVPAEAYLFSVNSSEMMSVMPGELLKAQTVAARNTLFATMGKHHHADDFHLCADDHCQCYRGSSRETPDSRRVTLATRGEVLVHDGAVCDARYSKMCGGLMESFDSVWNEDPAGYLPAAPDMPPGSPARSLFPADTEERAAAYILNKPECWCNTTQGDIPPYLTYTAPYFRWEFHYERAEAEEMISKQLGHPIGELKDLQVVSRGKSGRIEYLRIVASGGEWVIGKELAIRKALSRTCLYSTAFVAEMERDADGRLLTVILRGGGWGHGAGMCQIGATMMAYKGHGYREIVSHYYPNSPLVGPGTAIPAAREEAIVAFSESRLGERCYEFYNCYAVAGCPVYIEGVALEAAQDSASPPFRQTQDGKLMDLEARGIVCEFLAFSGTEAKPKS